MLTLVSYYYCRTVSCKHWMRSRIRRLVCRGYRQSLDCRGQWGGALTDKCVMSTSCPSFATITKIEVTFFFL